MDDVMDKRKSAVVGQLEFLVEELPNLQVQRLVLVQVLIGAVQPGLNFSKLIIYVVVAPPRGFGFRLKLKAAPRLRICC